jgi:hypothetical protein
VDGSPHALARPVEGATAHLAERRHPPRLLEVKPSVDVI